MCVHVCSDHQNVHLGFPVRCYEKIQMRFLTNPIFIFVYVYTYIYILLNIVLAPLDRSDYKYIEIYRFTHESESEISQSCLTLCDPMDCSLPGSSIHGFSRQEYWSGLPLPSPGDLLNPGIEPGSPAL